MLSPSFNSNINNSNIESDNQKQIDLVKPWESSRIILDKTDVPGKLLITVSSKLYIDVENVKPRLKNLLRRMAAFSNPEFYKKKNMGFSTHGIPRIIFCGYDESNFICLPRGLLDTLELHLQNANIDYQINDLRQQGKSIRVEFKGTLYDEQQIAVDTMLKFDNGILAATTSFGKTVVGAYMIAKLKTSTLILVHNSEILKNWEEDLDNFLK